MTKRTCPHCGERAEAKRLQTLYNPEVWDATVYQCLACLRVDRPHMVQHWGEEARKECDDTPSLST